MADLAYRQVHAVNGIHARLRLVTTYHQAGSIRETAPHWHTHRQVVRKWIRRYQPEGSPGLEDRSHGLSAHAHQVLVPVRAGGVRIEPVVQFRPKGHLGEQHVLADRPIRDQGIVEAAFLIFQFVLQ